MNATQHMRDVRGHRKTLRNGASLLEVAVVVVIVGVGIAAIMEFLVAATRTNARLETDTRAVAIARSAHEWAQRKTPLELQAAFVTPLESDPRYKVFAPTAPALLDADGLQLNDADPQRTRAYSQWSEELRMRPVSETNLADFDASGASRFMEITVIVRHRGQEVTQLRKIYGTGS